MILNEQGMQDVNIWREKGYKLPGFDRTTMRRRTSEAPAWVHFGAGNLFHAFQAMTAQRLLEEGLMDTGIIAVQRREKKPDDSDGLIVLVTLCSDGSVGKTIVGSVAERLSLCQDDEELRRIFRAPSLQMVTFTITEKGYRLDIPEVTEDLQASPDAARSFMGRLARLLLERYRACARPLALVSMDNCSHNGDRLRETVLAFADAWGVPGFGEWLRDSVSFPWTMIDKITPGPDASVGRILQEDGLAEGTPYVNAEQSEYLVVEDDFPNGRPPFERAGWYMTDRDTVDRAERMKVCTCLNPVHTALAVFGCLLGYDLIWREMQDEDLKRLAYGIGHLEGLPVVTDPGILRPDDFLRQVLTVRFPNPFLPDTPQRIATDTSQKLPVRFGATLRAYGDRARDLTLIPLVYAGWLRYLLAVDDAGRPFCPSADPLLQEAQQYLGSARLGDRPDAEKLQPLFRRADIFGVDLVEAGLAEKITGMFGELSASPGAVRSTLHKYVSHIQTDHC